jgi:hypothetical protein
MEGSWIELHLLLEQDGTETSVESSETLVLQHLTESTNKSTGVCRLGNETNTGGLERAESNISEEFCAGRGDEVDGDTVVGGRLVANEIDGLLLEEFITSELKSSLEEVSSSGGTETSQESSGALLRDDLTDTAKQSLVVCEGVELYSCLDAAEMFC